MPHQIHATEQPPRFTKRSIHIAPRRHELSTPFIWPLRALGDVAPRVLASHEHERLGVDLGYAPASIPDGGLLVPVYAVNDGEVACAIEGKTGCAISLDHGGTWSTHYTGLGTMAVIRRLPRLRARQFVRAGEVIGYASRPRIGFELWNWTDDRGFVAVDPRPHLAAWATAAATSDVQKEAA